MNVMTRPEVARAPWRALPIVLTGNFLAVLDFFIVNVALPSIGRDLRAAPAVLELLVAGYAAAYASGLVIAGRLGDALGRRRFYIGGVLAFTAASAACALAPNPLTLVLARLAQGLAASVMVPQVLASVQGLFHGRDRQRAMGMFGAGVGAATVIGQVAGALLVAADVGGLGWRPIFSINVPIGLACAAAAVRRLPETASGTRARLDVGGAVLLTAALVMLLLPLSLGRDLGWPPWCAVSLVASAASAAAFWRTQVRGERAGRVPLLPPALLRVPATRRGLVTAALFFIMAGGFLLTTAVILQSGIGLDPLDAGLTLAPYALGFLTVSLTVRGFAARFGRGVVVSGGIVTAVGLVGMCVQVAYGFGGLTPAWLVPAMALNGIGQAMIMIPLFGVILGGVPPERAGVAGGALTTTQQAGLAIGAAALGTTLFAVAASASWRDATLTVLTAEAALAGLTALAARRLP